MKNCVLLIIVYTNFIHCCDFNISDYSDHTCPFTLLRPKRELPEYTRWRGNVETTQEFIVKVLDDDLSTINSKQINAFNMLPHKKGGEKIIIGGVMVPKPTTATIPTTDLIKDYTRFVPPTSSVTVAEGKLYLAPIPQSNPDLNKIIPMQPHGRHPQRDESPPAGPQFLPRTPETARQYAPIKPVGFTRQTAMSPVAPVYGLLRQASPKPTRTSPFAEVIIPTRTKSDYEELRRYQPSEEDADTIATLTTRTSQTEPEGSVLEINTTLATEPQMSLTTKISSVDDTETREDKKIYNGESDAAYRSLFYNDYDDHKTIDKESDEVYDDKINIEKETPVSTDVTTEGININSSSMQAILNYEEMDETTNKISSSSNTTANIGKISYITLNGFHKKERRPACSVLKLSQLNFDLPRTLPEIVHQLKHWAENSPVAKWTDITNGNFTTMENPIYMLIVDDPSSGQIDSAKQTVMIVAGIQGRDHYAVTAAMYILYQLVERNEAHADLLTKYRFWIIPVFNPDGYDYSMTFPQRREWTKNLRQSWNVCKGKESCRSCEAYGIRCTVQPCYGVNLDRNFEYQWIPGEELKLEHPCGPLYAGSRQLSEVETRALTTYLHAQKKVNTFIALKEGGVLGIMYPYSHSKKPRTFDSTYRLRASRAAAAANSISGRNYVAGQTSEFLPLYAGGIEDWVDSHLGIDNTYTIMMFRPLENYNSKLVLQRVIHEAYAAMDTLVLQTAEFRSSPPLQLTSARRFSSTAAVSKPSSAVLLAFILALFI